jgi:hypothetical protein
MAPGGATSKQNDISLRDISVDPNQCRYTAEGSIILSEVEFY